MVGVNRFSDKERRKIRRKNHIAKDLHKNKYFQRVIPGKKGKNKNEDFFLGQEDPDEQDYY